MEQSVPPAGGVTTDPALDQSVERYSSVVWGVGKGGEDMPLSLTSFSSSDVVLFSPRPLVISLGELTDSHPPGGVTH